MVRKISPVLTQESLTALGQNETFMTALNSPGALVDLARDYIPDIAPEELAYLQAIPPVLQEAVRASIAAAIDGSKEVQVLYAPAYDFELHIWDYGEAVSVQVRGPYTEATMPERFPAQ